MKKVLALAVLCSAAASIAVPAHADRAPICFDMPEDAESDGCYGTYIPDTPGQPEVGAPGQYNSQQRTNQSAPSYQDAGTIWQALMEYLSGRS